MAYLLKNELVTYEEYLKIKDREDERLEYIDGLILMSPSPSIAHQRVSMVLSVEFSRFLKGKECEVFAAPTDIELVDEERKNLVIPDLSIICDKSGFTKNKYVGIPSLIVEILSPSNQSDDLVRKMNLYMNYGVKEYWIVNPMNKSIVVYSLDANGGYEQYSIAHKVGVVKSKNFEGLKIDLEDLFD